MDFDDMMNAAAAILVHPDTTREQRRRLICALAPSSRSSDYYKSKPEIELIREAMKTVEPGGFHYAWTP